MKLHPDTTVEVGDLQHARKIATMLRNDEDFYLYCSKQAQYNYKVEYDEDKFYNTFTKQFKVS